MVSGAAAEERAKFRNRRVVTGLDAQGRSCVLFDGPPSPQTPPSGQSGYATALLWRSNGAGEAPMEDAGGQTFNYRLEPGGSAFLMLRLPEAAEGDELASGRGEPELHASDRTDYIVVVEGEVTLVLEEAEVILKAGDVVVDRGVAHAWRNNGNRPAVMAAVMVAGLPLEAAAP